MRSPDALNRASYDAIAARWDEVRRGLSDREREYLDALLEGLPAPSAVLDLGCGTGRPIAAELVARGHRVTGVDQSGRMLDVARRRLPGARWIESRMEDYVPDESFAAVVCWDALFHVERARHRSILATVVRALAPGGRLMLTVGGSAHRAFTDTMLGETFFYDSHPPAQVLALLRRLGLVPVVAEFTSLPTLGRDKGRYAIVARDGNARS